MKGEGRKERRSNNGEGDDAAWLTYHKNFMVSMRSSSESAKDMMLPPPPPSVSSSSSPHRLAKNTNVGRQHTVVETIREEEQTDGEEEEYDQDERRRNSSLSRRSQSQSRRHRVMDSLDRILAEDILLPVVEGRDTFNTKTNARRESTSKNVRGSSGSGSKSNSSSAKMSSSKGSFHTQKHRNINTLSADKSHRSAGSNSTNTSSRLQKVKEQAVNRHKDAEDGRDGSIISNQSQCSGSHSRYSESTMSSSRKEEQKAAAILQRVDERRKHQIFQGNTKHHTSSNHSRDPRSSRSNQHSSGEHSRTQQQQQHQQLTNPARARSSNCSSLSQSPHSDSASSSDISVTSMYIQPQRTSDSSITASPNVVYQALRTGTSSSLSNCGPYNLNDVLKSSASELSSQTPLPLPTPAHFTFSTTLSQATTTPSTAAAAAAAASQPEEITNQAVSALPSSSSHNSCRSDSKEHSSNTKEDGESVASSVASSVLRQRLVQKGMHGSFNSKEEMSYYQYVTRHTILQLVTEDLMSDNWKLVDYALYRLCEVCCSESGSDSTDNNDKDNETDKQQQEEVIAQAASNRIRFIKAGGHALLVGVMKKYPRCADLQTSACRLIYKFIQNDREGAFSELLGAVNGIDTVLAAIQQFPPNQEGENKVHRHACGALAALVCSNVKQVNQLMQDPLHLVYFIQAMKMNSTENSTSNNNSNAVVGLCKVLQFITTQPDYHEAVVMAGGVEEIIREMKKFADTLQVQLCGCAALGNIVSSSAKSATAEHIVNDLEGAQIIGAAMKNFPDVEELQEKAVFVLFNFSNWRTVQAPIKKAGGLSALGIALENFPESKAIQKLGYAAMKRLLEAGRCKSPDPE